MVLDEVEVMLVVMEEVLVLVEVAVIVVLWKLGR